MALISRLKKRLIRDWQEFLHDSMIYVTDYKQQAPETRKIRSVLLIVSYFIISIMALKAWSKMPPPSVPLAMVLIAIALLGLLVWWMVRTGHLP
jgi:Flp pilus assembly protein TadB